MFPVEARSKAQKLQNALAMLPDWADVLSCSLDSRGEQRIQMTPPTFDRLFAVYAKKTTFSGLGRDLYQHEQVTRAGVIWATCRPLPSMPPLPAEAACDVACG